ncbi:MAG: lamin tail domain-containing protein, partial [Flavobacteriaceae bacterium]|nr:lamin tail domain-containing protein [Flavobacteriaceae bacterium]
MKKIYFFLAAIFAATMSFGQSPGDIIITEIMQNPSAVSDANGEYFEVYNTTAGIIDMNGWVIKDDDNDSHTINNGSPLNIAPGAYLVFGKNGSTGNGGVTLDYVYTGIILANGGDEVILETGGGTEIDRVDYDGGPNFPDPSGKSMEL